jgi:single stranded DNA-binding protein
MPPLEVTQWDKDIVNNVQIIGNVGSLEARALPSGSPVTTLNLAIRKPQRPQDAASSVPSESMWVTVTAFDTLAQQVAEHVKKGDQILVSGRLRDEQWQDKTTGQPRSKLSIIAAKVASVAPSTSTRRSMEMDAPEPPPMQGQSRYQGQRAEAVAPAPAQSSPALDKDEELWRDLYQNPGDWYDNRATVGGTKRPDYKHKTSGKALWLGDKNPAWVTQEFGTRGAYPQQVGSESRSTPLVPASEALPHREPSYSPPTKAPF